LLQNIFKEKKKEKKNIVLFLSVLILFGLTLTGCGWFSEGILNVFDPKAAIRVNFTEIDFTEGEGTIDLEIYSINQVEFIGEKFSYKYYNNGVLISDLSKTVGMAFYVAPSNNPGSAGPITEIENLPLYYQEVLDYVKKNPMITEITCTISLIGTDGAGHDITKSVTFDLPAVQPGIDFEPPSAVINVTPGTAGNAPFTVQFDATGSTDDRGIASYSWDFGDGTTGSGVMPPAHTYTTCGTYVVKLTVTDYWNNKGYAVVVINVGETGGPNVIINVTPGTTGVAPFTVYFDASNTTFETECGVGTATYSWDFGDGTTGTGVTISHEYAVPGTYIVILSVTDSDDNIGYGSVTIKVNTPGLPSEIILQAIPATVNVGGGTSQIIATVKDSTGNPVPNGTVVTFITTFGTLSSYTETTLNGIAITQLTLSSEGSATVTAISGSVSKSVIVTCPPAPTP